ncbi:MAG TPA: RHS repeat-associated core domain-containing protein [Gemmatimonadales bacterium]|nr:RHS repeat-associated core domain-containing protein [Gemmatimonadales bacterium]
MPPAPFIVRTPARRDARVVARTAIAVLALTFLLLAATARSLLGQAGGRGVQPMAGQCGTEDNPCLPAVYVSNVTPISATQPTEAGPFTVTFTVTNNGQASGTFEVYRAAPDPQLRCGSVTPSLISLAQGRTRSVTATYSTLAIGTYTVVYHVVAEPGGKRDSAVVTVTVQGTPLVSHAIPGDGMRRFVGGTVRATFDSPTSPMDTTSIWIYIDNVDRTATLQPQKTAAGYVFPASRFNLTGGVHTWRTYACNVNGRCESAATTFEAVRPLTAWALDDSLPPGDGAVSGLLGGLPLPPEHLRGCPVNVNDPEIRLVEPVSFLSQPGSAYAPGGLVFAASLGFYDDSIDIATNTVDYEPPDETTCADFGYVSPFDWGYWLGTDPADMLWNYYPYSDRGELGSAGSRGGSPDPLQALEADGLLLVATGKTARRGPNPTDLAGRWALRGSALRRGAKPLTGWRRARQTPAPLLPDPRGIDTASVRIVLNGTTLVSGGRAVSPGVRIVSLARAGQRIRIPINHPAVNIHSPPADSGWNEVVATIADTGGRSSSVRARFVQLPPGTPAPIALKPVRNFSKVDQGECAAFGVFQCGGAMLTHSIPGFVTRDRDRSLHLVYRSASQRAPIPVPVELDIRREQKAPRHFMVELRDANNATLDSSQFWFAGLDGAPSEPGAVALWEDAHERRVVGSMLPAAPPGAGPVRRIRFALRAFYALPGAPPFLDDTVSQEVVRLHLTDTLDTRFGPGWQLAELGRLVTPVTYQGTTAAIWLTGDGSYAIFKKVNGLWISPPGESATMGETAATAPDSARYVIALDNGARIGFRPDGWQAWTADLIGNRTRFGYAAGGKGRLRTITDPSGVQYRFDYETGHQVVAISQIRGTTIRKIAALSYDGNGRLARIINYTSAGGGDTTRFGYHPATTYGAYLTSVTDPRSTTAAPVVTTFADDDRLFTPISSTRPPGRLGPATALFRDPWLRAVPRPNYGVPTRFERLPSLGQLRGTSVSFANQVTDFRVDRFGFPTWMRDVSDGTTAGGFHVPGEVGDHERHVERDSVGRVTKIVQGRNTTNEADSVMYRYDAFGRVDRVIRTTLEEPAVHALDTLAFTYDSVALTTGGKCARLRSSRDPLGGVDSVHYVIASTTGPQGPGACLPAKIVGFARDSTKFTYGPLTLGHAAGVRPVSIRDPFGIVTAMTYDAATWNSAVATRSADGASSRMYYDAFGRPDSVVDAEGHRTAFLRDWLGRVTHQKTGTGPLAPVTRTIYAPGGLVSRVDVYASEVEGIDVPKVGGAVQSTHYYHNRLGEVDSVVGPGQRSPTKTARKQTFYRDQFGTPYYAFTGNGSFVGRIPNWRGQARYVYHHLVMPGSSVDGEPFADAATVSRYQSLGLTMGQHFSAGQRYELWYNNEGQVESETGWDGTIGALYTRFRSYTAAGALRDETLTFQDAVRVSRTFRYNRRGQRTLVTDAAVDLRTGQPLGEGAGKLEYAYNAATGRLDSLVAYAGPSAASLTPYAVVKWIRGVAGRDALRIIRLEPGTGGTDQVTTETRYDAAGRRSFLQTRSSVGAKVWYQFGGASCNKVDDLLGYTATEPGAGTGKTYGFTYASDGTRRLVQSVATLTGSRTSSWRYDVFGNRVYATGTQCPDGSSASDTLLYGADNRLVRRTQLGCAQTWTDYATDQAGNRLLQAPTVGGVAEVPLQLTYTAANQLYFSRSPTASPVLYDANWHWYDAQGLRLITHGQTTNAWFPRLDSVQPRTYYVYDGSDVALTLGREWQATARQYTYFVRQRFVSVGVDAPVVVRTRGSPLGAVRTLALVADRAGSTVVAVRPDGLAEGGAVYFSRTAFGALESPSGSGGSINPETGFTGASTPNPTGGFTYLRHRWYDPETGRFLTQDPIGLAGGKNLCAYARD